jgi:Spy/CpxP family protein refolding chaperone
MFKTSLWFAAALLYGLTSAGGAPAAETRAPAPPSAEQTNLQVLLDTVRANRKALVAVNLNLTDEESARFWPIYERYQKEMSAIGDRILKIVEDYVASFRDLSDEKALALMRAYLAAEEERLKVRRSYLDQFAQVLPGRTVARFYQLENKMEAVLQYDLAATIPVVDTPDGERGASARGTGSR